KKVKYHLENGKTLTINAPNVSDKNPYIQSVKLNGKVSDEYMFDHGEILKGGVLDFEMSDKSGTNPFFRHKYADLNNHVAVPVIDAGPKVFSDHIAVSMSTITSNSKIYFTNDGSEPTAGSMEYREPVLIDKTMQIKAIAVAPRGIHSQVAEANYIRKPNNWTVKIDSKYNRQYTGGGDEGLIDGIRGNLNFASGEWQGYQGQDFVATVDLQKETQVLVVGGGFLQNAKSWIWMPTHIEFELSSDGVDFQKVADIKTDVATTDMDPKIRDYTMPLKPRNARYVRIHAYNLGKIPAWHPGAGDDAFIFVDEIIIK
ncbi:MAG: chitobiase/beta-hexosaminidase C-terminal domain-containing protein, partial [Acidobacteriota bacterium]